MTHFLVTGGAGFIGSHLVEALLAEGHSVRVLDDLSSGSASNVPTEAEFVDADVTDPISIKHALDDIEGCFHLAAIASIEQCRNDWLRSHRVNLGGTVCVFEEACRVQRIRGQELPVVYASSSAVYGNIRQAPIAEDAEKWPASTYGVDKLACELYAAVGRCSHELTAVGLRFFNVYGPRQDPQSPYSGVVSIFCHSIARGMPIEIHGDGTQIRDFVYVEDAVCALRRAMNRATLMQSGAVFNVCTGTGTSIGHLADTASQLRGLPLRSRRVPRRLGDPSISIGDPRQALARLQFSARIPLEDGLRRTFDWLSG